MRGFFLLIALALSTCEGTPEQCGAWLQWGGDPSHAGQSCSAAQPMSRQLGEVKFDPFVEAETAEEYGDILIHYQVPLIAGDDVYIMAKSGIFTPCDLPIPPDTNPVCNP